MVQDQESFFSFSPKRFLILGIAGLVIFLLGIAAYFILPKYFPEFLCRHFEHPNLIARAAIVHDHKEAWREIHYWKAETAVVEAAPYTKSNDLLITLRALKMLSGYPIEEDMRGRIQADVQDLFLEHKPEREKLDRYLAEYGGMDEFAVKQVLSETGIFQSNLLQHFWEVSLANLSETAFLKSYLLNDSRSKQEWSSDIPITAAMMFKPNSEWMPFVEDFVKYGMRNSKFVRVAIFEKTDSALIKLGWILEVIRAYGWKACAVESPDVAYHILGLCHFVDLDPGIIEFDEICNSITEIEGESIHPLLMCELSKQGKLTRKARQYLFDAFRDGERGVLSFINDGLLRDGIITDDDTAVFEDIIEQKHKYKMVPEKVLISALNLYAVEKISKILLQEIIDEFKDSIIHTISNVSLSYYPKLVLVDYINCIINAPGADYNSLYVFMYYADAMETGVRFSSIESAMSFWISRLNDEDTMSIHEIGNLQKTFLCNANDFIDILCHQDLEHFVDLPRGTTDRKSRDTALQDIIKAYSVRDIAHFQEALVAAAAHQSKLRPALKKAVEQLNEYLEPKKK